MFDNAFVALVRGEAGAQGIVGFESFEGRRGGVYRGDFGRFRGDAGSDRRAFPGRSHCGDVGVGGEVVVFRRMV